MTAKPRASLGFADDDDLPNPAEALKNFDPTAFDPAKPQPSNSRPDKESVRKAGEAAGFKSREGGKPAAVAVVTAGPRLRRNHTGRSEQVNVKATPDYKARFQALGAKQSWTDVVLLEKLIELGEKQFGQ